MEEKSRIQQAMNHIEEAQSSLERAVMELAGVRGMNADCDRISTLRDHVESSWHVLKNNLQRAQNGVTPEV